MMSFNEKIAWLSCGATILVAAYYIEHVLLSLPPDITPLQLAYRVLPSVIAIIVIMIAGSIVAAITSPKDTDRPMDEREKLIEGKSAVVHSIAVSFLLTLAFGHMVLNADFVIFAALVPFILIISDFGRYVVQIAHYRHWL